MEHARGRRAVALAHAIVFDAAILLTGAVVVAASR